MAKYMSSLGYDLILGARNKEKLEELKTKLSHNAEIILCDLSNKDNFASYIIVNGSVISAWQLLKMAIK